MARRRKTEVNKTSVKQQSNSSAVRKSTRQRAKKQLEEQKVNGEILDIVSNSDNCKNCVENSHESSENINIVSKISTRYKSIVDKEKSLLESGNSKDGESDNQEDLETDLPPIEKLGSLEQKDDNTAENIINEIVWPEDVIEETIICEEMEVETEMADECSIAQDDNIVLEQVLLVNDSNFDNKNVVEYTVIQNDDGTESMMVTPQNLENVTSMCENYSNSNRYQIIEQGLSVLNMTASEIICPLKESESFLTSENDKCINALSYNFDNSAEKLDADTSKNEYRSLRSITKNIKGSRPRKVNNVLDKNIKKDSDYKKKTKETNTKKISSIVENKSDVDNNKPKSIKTKKGAIVSTNINEENGTLNCAMLLQNSLILNQEDDNSSSMSDKVENQEISDTFTVDSVKDSKSVHISLSLEQNDLKDYPVDTNIDISNCVLTKSHNLLLNSEEYSRDSETEGKIDSEDTKVSSSSENSNDTLLSSNSCKILDFNVDNKNTLNHLNEVDKKPSFRSRSGSTDTTGSESGSNSSGVRRSNRIRTIGLMKQRSRGRGLVTKPSVESTSKSIIHERDKLISNTPPIQEKDINPNKDNLDNVSETQSDKENANNKTVTTQEIAAPLNTTSGTSGYDSDSNKPVKVKSRWRRSSELEMSNSGCWSISKTHLGCNSTIPGAVVGISSNSSMDANSKSPSVSGGLLLQNTKSSVVNEDTAATNSEASLNMNIINEIKVRNTSLISASDTIIPKAVGAKISLPMVSGIEDREMEERLSQFEHLKENLYLTERYTSKETKRMVCDCFLTEEEFQRGELGCGEDCLNRLLMIECGSRCVVGNRCTNRRFQNCEYAKCEVFRTEKKGFGLRAVNDLNAGDFIMEYVGEVIEPKDFRRRAKEYSKDKNRHYYFMALKSDQIIDATMKGNISRFINHSCDPNAETQKWTVNGELRIGFFNTKFVAAGEEITFDYHFQRYGKEAQKCFCEAANCRGWIGGNPDDNKDKVEYGESTEDLEDESEDDLDYKNDNEDKEEKPTKKVRRKTEEKKVIDHMEDEDLEEQIDKLCSSGLKNRAHTLTLSRLMVRSREIQHRTRLLKVIQSGEQPCRRLFLDYHGLRLIWSYMMDVAGNTTEEACLFRLEILKALSSLPIPNRTMLIDSKVLSIIEKWSKQLYNSSSGDSPEDDQSKLKSSNEEVEIEKSEKFSSENLIDSIEIKKEVDQEPKSEKTDAEHLVISEIAANLLVDWSNLKEVFRIPKKERIEQMKEHEREADRGYKEDTDKEAKETTSYERHRCDRYSRNELEKRTDRRKGRDSPEFEYNRSKDKRGLEERPNLVPVPRMSKFERRQLFALKVAKEEEERQRRQQEDSWQQHQAQCMALGLDPYTTAAFDPQSGYPLFFNPQLSQWQPYPMQAESSELGQPCTSMYIGSSSQTAPIVAPPLYPLSQPTTYGSLPVGPNSLVQIHNGTSTVHVEKHAETMVISQAELEADAPLPPPPPLDLPPKWKWARDKRGRIYYYHAKERVSQWLPPPPDHIAVQPDSSTTSESSDESSSSNEEEDEDLDEHFQQKSGESMEVDISHIVPMSTFSETKKRRDGLVQERIISPRREEDRVDHKKYKEIKEKLRRQKERAKLKEHFEKMKKHRRSKSKTHIKHSTSKFQPIASDMSPTMERKIKDTFRINMANVMVHFLNPYRKSDCRQGRITNTEDFKHLARKLTHFVLAKELKHCKSVDELECNDNVKHKAKDFVRKYMSKFGAVYQKGTDED